MSDVEDVEKQSHYNFTPLPSGRAIKGSPLQEGKKDKAPVSMIKSIYHLISRTKHELSAVCLNVNNIAI